MTKTILIADDSPIIRKMLCGFFRESKRYDICAEASNGEEAIALAVEHRPTLIIMDLSMPVLNGLDAAREVKKILPAVPIILFTQYAQAALKNSDAHLYVDRIVDKLDLANLMVHVEALVPAGGKRDDTYSAKTNRECEA